MIIRWAILRVFIGGTPEAEFDGDGRVLSLSLGGMDIFIAVQRCTLPFTQRASLFPGSSIA